MAFESPRMVKRRLMEASQGVSGGAEVRRLHIVYFLSRKGRIEHPHLFRVHHNSRNGVRLRDIKRWLGELRGKDMPGSFSWSYKRKYKTGYVWQDLVDDELITPISDNEYVLKGSEVSSTTTKDFLNTDDSVSNHQDQKTPCKEESLSHSSEYVSMKSSSEIEEESPTFGSETSTLTDDSGKLDRTEKATSSTTKQEQNQEDKMKPSSKDEKSEQSLRFYSSLLSNKKSKRRTNKVTVNEQNNTIGTAAESVDQPRISSSTPSDSSHFMKSKSYSNGASIFKNFITCGAVDTNDSAVVEVSKPNKTNFLNMCSSDMDNIHSAAICKRDKLGGSHRVIGTPAWTQQQVGSRKSFDGAKDSAKNQSELRSQKAASAASKLANVPNCSQCGKPFKPDKLHSHMKSCKGLKALSKANAAISAEKSTKASTNIAIY